ncbi:hypothetical protein P7C73_g4376, partial [Tremellales sp. Uapishka_1]
MPPLSFLKSSPAPDSPSSPSKYRPSRLLRRKTSVKSSSGPATSSSVSSTFSEQQSESPHEEVVVIPSRRITDHQQTLVDTNITHNRPLTPPALYPTALSPPRRPAYVHSPRSNASSDYSSPLLSPQILTTLSAVGAPSPSPSDLSAGPSPSAAAWLARKPSRKLSTSKRKLDDSVQLRCASSSSTENESAEPDSDGEVGLQSKRSIIKSGNESGGYEVEIICSDSREECDELRWEVVIRKKAPKTAVPGSSSPLHLSTSSSTAQAPSSASSINLSLALDQPTGKLVFIAFPMDLHATPTRRRPSASIGTPPMNGSPSTPSRRKPSPSPFRTSRGSPPMVPRDLFTPRRSKQVSASQLDGGLYAKGSGDLEVLASLSLEDEVET